jgi:cellobiose transport system substrate-binding protein
MSRRRLLQAAALAGLSVGAAACSTDTNDAKNLSLWLWKNSCSPEMLAPLAKGIPGADGATLTPNVIGGDFGSKLLITLAGRTHVPDLTFLNSDVATYFPNADQFVDLYSLGAKDLQKDFLPFKWNFGVNPAGRMVAFPMDTGPTATFFRTDLLEKAGLPHDPDTVEKVLGSWADFIAFGSEIKKAVKGGVVTPTLAALYIQVMAQSPKQYVDAQGHPIYSEAHVQNAWDICIKAFEAGISANAQQTTDQTALLSNGKQVAQVHAVWWVVAGPEQLAPNTKGKWRVCPAPAGPGNYGGSFVAISKYCKNPEAAWKFITFLENKDNEVTNLSEMFLFPSRLDALADKAIAKPYDFFGGQPILEVFSAAAKGVPLTYYSPYDSLVSTPIQDELTNVEATGKSPAAAWKDAMASAKRELGRIGVS